MQLQPILRFANFYCRFIQGYSTLASPLSAPTSPKVPFTWSPNADRAFRDLKHCFTTAPVLVHPDPHRQFVLEANASDVGVGAAQDLKLHPCAASSLRLNAMGRIYDAGNRELLGVKIALEE